MEPTKIRDVVAYLESWAPPDLQEAYDNSGLLTGSPDDPVTGVLTTLDCTEVVIDEALAAGANLIIAHHPIIFKGLKRLTGSNYVERTIIHAIRNRIAIYAIHTNLDNVSTGVNHRITERLGLLHVRILSPRVGDLAKLVTFIPTDHVEKVTAALFTAGAGQIGKYSDCSFQLEGKGTFTPGPDANPYTGTKGVPESANEVRVEVLIRRRDEFRILAALRESHPYEEVAYYVSDLRNANQDTGSGMIGELKEPMDAPAFIQMVKKVMQTPVVRHTTPVGKIQRVAVCGGAGSFLLGAAQRAGADVLITADFKYHEFFDADGKIMVADIGHYESEQFTKELLVDVLTQKFRTFAINFSKTNTNPLRYS